MDLKSQFLGIGIFTLGLTITMGMPFINFGNKCNDSNEYLTTTRILNASILYSITTFNNFTKTSKVNNFLYVNPSFDDYINLITVEKNISMIGKIFFEYEIVGPCYFNCIINLYADKYTSKQIAKNIEIYYQPGNEYHMMCNSFGCRIHSYYCETILKHDEL